MNKETAGALVEKNLTAIYGYAYSKLYDKSRAEELASDIVLEILNSAENLKNEAAFWGYAWRIAENTFRTFIRREQLRRTSIAADSESIIINIATEDGEAEAHDSEINRLRRELALLGKRYREVCVSYYINNKSCSCIAEEQNISVEAVKQLLFKARKLLKEGMEMERKFGEKSYNPGVCKLDFWGDWNHYGHICDRKLPGAILLSAYDKPMTLEELSVEIGVAMPYLEDETEMLLGAGLLRRNGKRVETNIIIRTDKYEKAFAAATKEIYPEVAKRVFDFVKEKLPRIRELDFNGKEYDDNRLLFNVINIALIQGYYAADEKSPIGQAPKLALGGYGWVSGYDNNFVNHHFKGITLGNWNKDNSARFAAVNYRAADKVQNFEHVNFVRKVEAMLDAVEEKDANTGNETLPYLIENGFIKSSGGKLSANFPVFSFSAFDELIELLKPVADTVADCMREVAQRAEDTLKNTVPEHLKEQCAPIAKIHHRLDVAAFVIEALIESGALTLPDEKVPLAVYGARK